ncbi:RdgB/HAM1 family non-canonical purine NTP pyrophosphatase [Hymenobacter jejuensis]|uniref:dITP/XTP pyrophosphatase n=1 Tax=Hymenobacter jejuensis TaxID=2502781 RepID=A0A5B8A0M8_9BACT|nr:RdgB/HAM1 family non-canonical purine NTP pyrophosphatase [Hymenobacter jejuensis]QDA60860.1 RdgB/HAM1 family non-canonical purine NTP pyrophosphatase [Hymenobacter jejuensis]
MRICFATNNEHKLTEVRPLLPAFIELVSLRDIGCEEELPETRDTLAGNARQKAEYVWEHYGVSCFADDTGLEVNALHGEPGVYSARYAGPQRSAADNVTKLLHELGTASDRSAQFRTVIALILPSGEVHEFAGEVRGSITDTRQGKDGFGYDPVFRPEGHDATFAEMTLAQKNTMSHRARAVQQLVAFLNTQTAGSVGAEK